MILPTLALAVLLAVARRGRLSRVTRCSADPLTPPRAGDFDFPATSGAMTGVAGLLVAGGGMVWALGAVHTAAGVSSRSPSRCPGSLSYAFMLRPWVRVTSGVLHLVNPFETTAIPSALVSRVSVRSATHVHVAEARTIGVAVGRRPAQMVRPRGEIAGTASPLQPRSRAARTERPLRRRERVPDMLEEHVGTLAKDAARESADPALRRTPCWAWWLIVPAAVLAAALLVSLLVR